MLSQYCLTVKQILADWPSLPNNLGGGGQLPLPRTPMHAKIEFNNYFIIYLLIKYETAAGCRKPFCVVTQFLTPSAVIISMSSWRLIFFHINVIRVGIDKNQCDLSFDIFFTVLLKE